MTDRINVILAALLVVLALCALLHLALLDKPPKVEAAEPSFPVLRLMQAPAPVSAEPTPEPEPVAAATQPAEPPTIPAEPETAAASQWDWTVDGQTFALDPETGEPAIPDEWLDTGCGCTDPVLVNYQPFQYSDLIPLSEDLQLTLWNSCQQYGIPYTLALALIQTESGFKVDADNGICRGLCALHRLYWPEDLPPGENIAEGMRVLAQHYETYGTWDAALCAYNAGHDTGGRTYSNIVLQRAAEWGEKLAC